MTTPAQTPSNVPRAPVPVVISHGNKAVTTSLAIAEYFGKNHRDVLRSIENLIADLPEDDRLRNFAQTVIEHLLVEGCPAGGHYSYGLLFIFTVTFDYFLANLN